MIDIRSLTDADRGRWVEYSARPCSEPERGRIKSWNERFIYVVYRCGGYWDDYQNYTAAPTLPEDLQFV
jgi:hypothetical protein